MRKRPGKTGGQVQCGWPVAAGLLLLTAGCCMPAAHVPPAEPANYVLPPKARALTQILGDSAVETVCHPCRSGRILLRDTADCLGIVGEGIFCRRLALRLAGPPGPLATPPPTDTEGPCALPGCEPQPAAIHLHFTGTDSLRALEHLIDNAHCRIDVHMFNWDPGPIGMGIAQRLAARAAAGVRVRVLVDGCGNLIFGKLTAARTPEINEAVCWLAQQPHVELLRIRNPWGHFDHRKLVVADGCLAWTGGRNFTSRGFCQHDLTFTLAGPLVDEIEQHFECYWQDQGGQPGEPLPASPALPNALAVLTETGPLQRDMLKAVFHAVDHACHHVWLENPYLADCVLISKLAEARRRGVDVRVVMTRDAEAHQLSRAHRVTINRLLQAGVRVYCYPGMLHTKALGVDSCWAYLGSGNFDTLSLRRNHEIGVTVVAGAILSELETQLFQRDFCVEWEVHQLLPVTLHDYAYELLANLWL